MPSFPCRWPTCTEYIAAPGYCPEHADKAPADRREMQRAYDKYQRDPEAKKFYDSAAWQRARKNKLTAQPTCELCGRFADMVHHKTPVKDSEEERTDQRNLMSLCSPCHSTLEAEKARGA